MFETKHIIILTICIALILTLFFTTRKWSLKNKYKAFFGVAIISETLKVFTYIIANEDVYGGILPKTDLPFHLCSIQIIFTIVVLFSKNEKIKRVLMAFMFPSGLIGGLAAILIPTQSSLTMLSITIQYFTYHVTLIVLALHIAFNKEFKFDVKDYLSCLIFVFCLMFVAIYLNSILYDGEASVNFMYVVKPPQDGLPFLNNEHGWLQYICHYAFLVLASITVCYIKPIIDYFKVKFNKQ